MMPLVTRNHVTESSSARITETPATILALRATPARRISSTWPTISTTQTIPIAANVAIQRMLGGCGASDGKSGKRLFSQGSSQIFSIVTANKMEVSSQVRLSVSDFRIGGWKLMEAICSLCGTGDTHTLMQIRGRLQPKMDFWLYYAQKY